MAKTAEDSAALAPVAEPAQPPAPETEQPAPRAEPTNWARCRYRAEDGRTFDLVLQDAGMQMQSTPQGIVITLQGRATRECPACKHIWPLHEADGCRAKNCGKLHDQARCQLQPPNYAIG